MFGCRGSCAGLFYANPATLSHCRGRQTHLNSKCAITNARALAPRRSPAAGSARGALIASVSSRHRSSRQTRVALLLSRPPRSHEVLAHAGILSARAASRAGRGARCCGSRRFDDRLGSDRCHVGYGAQQVSASWPIFSDSHPREMPIRVKDSAYRTARCRRTSTISGKRQPQPPSSGSKGNGNHSPKTATWIFGRTSAWR